MRQAGWVAFGAVVGWWLVSRPLSAPSRWPLPRPLRPLGAAAGWLALLVAAGAAAVTYANAGDAALLPAGGGLLGGAGGHALFRAAVRRTLHHETEVGR